MRLCREKPASVRQIKPCIATRSANVLARSTAWDGVQLAGAIEAFINNQGYQNQKAKSLIQRLLAFSL